MLAVLFEVSLKKGFYKMYVYDDLEVPVSRSCWEGLENTNRDYDT